MVCVRSWRRKAIKCNHRCFHSALGLLSLTFNVCPDTGAATANTSCVTVMVCVFLSTYLTYAFAVVWSLMKTITVDQTETNDTCGMLIVIWSTPPIGRNSILGTAHAWPTKPKVVRLLNYWYLQAWSSMSWLELRVASRSAKAPATTVQCLWLTWITINWHFESTT